MAFDTFPCNPYPISKGMLEKGNNDELNTRVTALEGEVSDLSETKANQITIAPFFDPEASYEVGDLVYYNGLTYRCTNDHEGEWDADDFAATTISGELDTLKSGLSNKAVLVGIELSGTTDANGDIGITGATSMDYPIAFIAGQNSSDYITFFDGSTSAGYQKYAHFATKTSSEVSGTVVCVRGVFT